MRTILKTSLLALLFMPAAVAWPQVPNTFRAGDAIRASEINENFNNLLDATQAIETRSEHESISVDVDCNADSSALVNALDEYAASPLLTLNVAGNCTTSGSFFVVQHRQISLRAAEDGATLDFGSGDGSLSVGSQGVFLSNGMTFKTGGDFRVTAASHGYFNISRAKFDATSISRMQVSKGAQGFLIVTAPIDISSISASDWLNIFGPLGAIGSVVVNNQGYLRITPDEGTSTSISSLSLNRGSWAELGLIAGANISVSQAKVFMGSTLVEARSGDQNLVSFGEIEVGPGSQRFSQDVDNLEAAPPLIQ